MIAEAELERTRTLGATEAKSEVAGVVGDVEDWLLVLPSPSLYSCFAILQVRSDMWTRA